MHECPQTMRWIAMLICQETHLWSVLCQELLCAIAYLPRYTSQQCAIHLPDQPMVPTSLNTTAAYCLLRPLSLLQ